MFKILYSVSRLKITSPLTKRRADNANRFTYGTPPSSSADWAWAQHMLTSLKDNGRATIVLDTGAVSRGSGSKHTDRERDIRKKFVEEDLIEGIVLLPENLFYNTTAPGIILLLNCNKPAERKAQFLLINLSQHFEKGKPKNILFSMIFRILAYTKSLKTMYITTILLSFHVKTQRVDDILLWCFGSPRNRKLPSIERLAMF